MKSEPSREHQPEFFDEFGEPRKSGGVKSALRSKINPAISVTFEQIVVFLVILIVILVGIYMIGYARGKAIKYMDTPVVHHTPAVPAADPAPQPAAAQAPPPRPAATPEKTQRAEALPKPVANRDQKPYTIQVSAYRSKDRALKEASQLKATGYEARIIARAGFYQVCVGYYANRNEAQTDLKRLRIKYNDSYLRKF